MSRHEKLTPGQKRALLLWICDRVADFFIVVGISLALIEVFL